MHLSMHTLLRAMDRVNGKHAPQYAHAVQGHGQSMVSMHLSMHTLFRAVDSVHGAWTEYGKHAPQYAHAAQGHGESMVGMHLSMPTPFRAMDSVHGPWKEYGKDAPQYAHAAQGHGQSMVSMHLSMHTLLRAVDRLYGKHAPQYAHAVQGHGQRTWTTGILLQIPNTTEERLLSHHLILVLLGLIPEDTAAGEARGAPGVLDLSSQVSRHLISSALYVIPQGRNTMERDMEGVS
ncbi:hypothetical protein NDU88_004164 [Pleurodeles waltl]|uniref:Uncharacterized protein n=1 Tax=Pleurodeles waltl TaxID=8319 RepID=A0AAV7V2T6_PLEWA|nr:hypothetical protein NDU88_004164 [Pleurodeles waltl]